MGMIAFRPGLVALLAALVLGAAPARAEDNSCTYAFDGECDEDWGTNLCTIGSDTWDCRRTGTPPGPESCRSSGDGVCDEPGGEGGCIPFTDTADCRAAGVDPLRGFYGQDDRVWPDSAAMPWRMIGRLTFVSGGHCSGAMVGPDVVLTAAHCLYGGEGPGTWDQPLEFIAGAAGAEYVARARVIGYYHAPEFEIGRYEDTSEIDGFDWAFLQLDAPIGNETGWMQLEPLGVAELEDGLAGGFTLMQAGYSADATAFLSANLACPLVQVFDDNTFFHECDTMEGDSGSPIFVRDGWGYRVIGIESAVYPEDDAPFDSNMAVDARSFGAGPPGPFVPVEAPPAPPTGGGSDYKNRP